MHDVTEIWSYLAHGPLLWLALTLAAFVAGSFLFERAGRRAWANPVLIAVGLVAAALELTGTSYATYFEGAQFVHFMLGPVTVALATPLWDNRAAVRRSLLPMAAALAAGLTAALGSVVLIGRAMGLPAGTILSMLPKSATAPVAIGVSEGIGGSPTLTAVLVILTGIVGAVLAPPLLALLRIRDPRARGFAVGLAAHGIGTAQMMLTDARAGAFAGIGLGVGAVTTALVAPLVAHWLF
ncbi:LrgB family protein [Cereibacter sphaeroides]|uniref:LrgB family protein n=1 Tax=Cereibacter sphaeroides TaxID=1063 RepID=UPI000191CAA5|nr:LrgB family protein [Cereibacter sphaeroides]ACM03364.1 LrgB family protein [Cereibacter sphaeroides KD131]AZB57212.1 LrgB family protein [Cereibacter sphaeroides]AZB61495.1 LrgB family protein [Cereibacter sphaeroides]EKX59967.1 LrgA-associated membrane protein LrgB [Rhodobacter sp. AKP1]